MQSSTAADKRCHPLQHLSYNVFWHLAAIFIVLGSSLIGTVLPILGKRVSAFRVPDCIYAIGKSMATGVVLGVALIHMLAPANDSLTSECLPSSIRNMSSPLAYLICLTAVAAMHTLEASLQVGMEGSSVDPSSPNLDEENARLLPHPETIPDQHDRHQHLCVALLDDPDNANRLDVLSAVLLEFGVSLHSLFVGLTVGICADSELYTLMFALSFHQFFEGVALGARIVEAALTPRTEYLFAAVFILSAPFGAAVGVMCVCENLVNTKGPSYLLTQGIFDAACAGILLYLGFNLLIRDFYADVRAHTPRVRCPFLFLLAMFLALWVGLAIMALIGQYL